jgi:putative DNA primase/helicase
VLDEMADSPNIFTPTEVSIYYAARVPKLNQPRRGESRGPCPIHQGEDDNFAVKSETGEWFCHSVCGRGGSLIDLEMELSGADFKVALAEIFRVVGRAQTVNGGRRRAGPSRFVREYGYTDEGGQLLFAVVRMDPKAFKQRRPNGKGGWIWNTKGIRLVLYRLAQLVKRGTETIFICEGERDVESLEGLGLLASCNPMGAGKWRTEYSETIRDRSVMILPDNDIPGRMHAATVAADLMRVRCEVRIIEVPKGKDVSDWLKAGGTVEELRTLASEPLTDKDLLAWRTRWELDTGMEAAKSDEQANSRADAESVAFLLTDEAVVYVDTDPDKEPLRICGRLEVAALTRDSKGDGWGRLLRWSDAEGHPHEWAMPMSLLAGDGNEYRARLLDGGLFLAPGRRARELLTVYLQTMRPQARALCVSRIGWHAENFVLPSTTIGPVSAGTILFQTPFEADHLLNVSGTLDEWREKVGQLCSGNSRLILATSCAFAGPVLALVGAESGGVHLVGPTSTGKSTALVVGGSVVGGGGRNGFVQSWRTTTNGLEAIAELHNDLTLFLDELAQLDPREAADVAYFLANGSGKGRMSRNIGARKKLSWSLVFVSAGEITLADHAQTAGKRTKGGAEVRLLNIDADARAGSGLFENIHGAESPDAFARQLKGAARQYYGTPLRAYLDVLAGNRAAVETALHNFQTDFLSRHVPADSSGEVFRAAQRFGLIAAAGELATDAGITGWAQDEATTAAARCLESWISSRGTTGGLDAESAVKQVRRFLEAHGASRFQAVRYQTVEAGMDSPDENQLVVNRAGFRRKTNDGETEYLMFPETFKLEVCASFDYRMVVHALEDRGFLERQPPSLLKRVRVPGNGDPIWVFCIKASILEG